MSESLFKILSDQTKAEVGKLEIVTPTLYKAIFSNLAQQHSINIEKEDKLTSFLLGDKIAEYNLIENKIPHYIQKMDEHLKNAIGGITNKNIQLLENTLKETEALKKEVEYLKNTIYEDALTKVHNRKWICENPIDEEKLFKQDGELVLVDMNFFKIINDTYGHIAGDKVLKYIADHLKKTEAEVSRYGGDEFILFFHKDLGLPEVIQIMHANREELLKKKLKFKKNEFHISFSYGAISYKKGESLPEAIESADTSMYFDKKKIKERMKDQVK